MALSPNVSTEEELRDAREEVLSLLRSKDSSFLLSVSADALQERHREIAQEFLAWLKPAAFALEIVALAAGKQMMFEGRWTHNGAVFVGFKQPPAAANPDDATILACAALLRNEWCRARLPN